MSYRTVKRVLGETSLERKCRFLFGGCLLLLITGSFLWYATRTDKLVYAQNRRAAAGLVDSILAVRHWEVTETNEDFKPLVKSIAESMQNQQYRWRTIKPEGVDGQPQDEFEWDLLARWKDADRKASQETVLSDENHLRSEHEYRYYQAIYTKPICIDCHRPLGNPQLVEGDLLAIMLVSLSDKQTVSAQHDNWAILLATALVTTTLAMLALWVIVRYVIVKPLKHLRDVSEDIVRGNVELRADIHTGDEFEELGAAFNRMLRHLGGAHQELRDLNQDLDSKVDELAQANMRLYEMNRLKSDFLATVSHELRTPLNSIIGFSDVLEAIDSLSEKQRRYVRNIQRSGRMLLEMINDILDLAKIESGKMEVKPSEFKIDQLIAAQCDMARPLTEKKNIDLDYLVQPGLPPLVQDQGKIQQILNNLLSNAIKFTPEGGRITVSAKQNLQGDLLLVVADTGVGIPENEQVVVFEKFRQGTSVLSGGDAMTRQYSGTGLGLSIVKEMCRLLGGEVTLYSELGKGSTFTVRLPWTRTQQPPLESALAHDLEQLARPRRPEYSPPDPIGAAPSEATS